MAYIRININKNKKSEKHLYFFSSIFQLFLKIPSIRFFFFKFLPNPKKNEINHVSEMQISEKYLIYAKYEHQVDSNLSCKFDHFWRNLSFWAPKTPLLDAQMRHDVIWNFSPIFIFSTLRIFYVKMDTSEWGGEEGGGLHILSSETTDTKNME